MTNVVNLNDVFGSAYVPGVYDARYFSLIWDLYHRVNRFSTAIFLREAVELAARTIIPRWANRCLVSGGFFLYVRFVFFYLSPGYSVLRR